MSKLSFRARALDASKPMPVYLAEELPDLPDYSAINRAVPQMPSGMEKEEECEHHLQRAICTGLIIPTPEVTQVSDCVVHDRIYPPDYRMPRQLIHMQPLGLEQDVPDYDMDSEDEKWLKRQQAAAGPRRCDLTELKFEETMERLERSSGQTVVTLREAKVLSGRNGPAEHVLAAVYDYWLNKRLATQQPLLLAVRTEARPGAPSPYLAFRRRTEKMQTRKNRKNDESSYEKMVKLRRELSRAVSLLELVRRRERAKRELIRLAAVLLDKRYQARDFSGHMIAEAAASRVAVAPPVLAPTYTAPHHHRPPVDPVARQREKRQYKRRKHRHHSSTAQPHPLHHGVVSGSSSSSEGEAAEAAPPPDPSGPFAFRRKPGCQYHMPTASFGPSVDVPWRNGYAKENTYPGDNDQRLRYTFTSLSHPTSRFIGLARRRLGRGGRIILDRLSSAASLERLWANMDYTITDSHAPSLSKPAADPYSPEKLSYNNSAYRNNCNELKLTEQEKEIVIKTECDDINDESVSWNSVSEANICRFKSEDDHRDGIVKMEMIDTIESDSVKVNERGDESFAEFCDDVEDGRYGDRSPNERRAEDGGFRMTGEEMRKVAELLVRRGLRRYESRTPHKTAAEVDEIFKDCIHFRPQSPPLIPAKPSSPPRDPIDGEVRLTDGAPICVQVLPPLPPDKPSDMLFQDTSLYTTSEFTLTDLYGDSLLPDTEIPEIKHSWIHTNGPDKLLDSNSDSAVTGSPTPSKCTFKDSSDNSSSNHTSVFTPSVGTPNSLNSCDDSNHAVPGTNGVEWNNDSNGSEKLKLNQINYNCNKSLEKRMGSSVFKLKNIVNEKQIFLASEKTYRPISPPPQAAPQGIFIPISSAQTAKKRPEGQGLAVVQVRAPSVVRQVIGRVGADGLGRPPMLVKAMASGGHKPVPGVQHKAPVQGAQHKTIGHNAVAKAVQQQIGRKLQQDAARRIGNDEQIIMNAGGQLMACNQQPPQQQAQQQQLVTVAVTESLKFRLQGHLARDGLAGQPGRRAVVQLSAAAPPGLAPSSSPAPATHGRQVKVVRTLTPAQRSRLLQAAGGAALDLRELAGMLQLRQQPQQSDPHETRAVHLNDAPAPNSAITNAVVVSAQPGSVVPPPAAASAQQGGASQQRKGPMEVT